MPTNTADQALTLPLQADAANEQTAFSSYNTGVESRLAKRYVDAADRTARNPTPTAGEISYLTNPGRHDFYTGTAWWELRPLFVNKATETQVVNNSTAFVNDSHLILPLQANARYVLDGLICHDAGTTADMKYDWIGPAGFSMPRWNLVGADTANAFTTVGSAANSTPLARVGLGIGTFVYLSLTGVVLTVATAGNLTLRWAQNAAEAVNNRVKQDSFIRLIRVG